MRFLYLSIVISLSCMGSAYGMGEAARAKGALNGALFFKKAPELVSDADIYVVRQNIDILNKHDRGLAGVYEGQFKARMSMVSQELQIKWLPEKLAQYEDQLRKEDLEKAAGREQQLHAYNAGLLQLIKQNPELYRQFELFRLC